MISDFMQTYLHLPRAYSLCIVSSLFIISQMAVMSVSSITALWMASVMVGVAYGSLLGVLPSVVIDWFGLGECNKPFVRIVNRNCSHTDDHNSLTIIVEPEQPTNRKTRDG